MPLVLPLNITRAPPRYKYRALFPNDEDLLAGFGPDPLGESVFGAQSWDRLCETALRLKANTVQCGTVSYPDESIAKISARRGLVYVEFRQCFLYSACVELDVRGQT